MLKIAQEDNKILSSKAIPPAKVSFPKSNSIQSLLVFLSISSPW
jgi:hypothetical protein